MIIRDFDTQKRVLVVAEIGNNHEGNFSVAQAMVRAAHNSGVHAVKFQTFRTEHFVSPADPARVKRLKSFELSYDQFTALADLAHSLGLLFISTPLDMGSAEFLPRIVDALKVASGDNNFYPLVEAVAQTGKPLIVSTGLSDGAQVDRTIACVQRVWSAGNHQAELGVLHCVCSYPVPPDQANLRSIELLTARKGITAGYSDHTIGIEAATLAVALGARIVEKHFTLDKNYSDFRDHKLSADPVEMKELMRRIQNAEAMLGEPEKRIQPCEVEMVAPVRRSIAAAHDLPEGHRILRADLAWLRPSGGVPPGEELALEGHLLLHPVSAGQPLHRSDVE